MRVALIVTGELERAALAASLQRVFPEHEFRVEMRFDGFTSQRVKNLGPTKVPGHVDKLAAALVAAVDPGRNGAPSDLAVLVDDLEIANLDQPDVVVATFRDAVERHVRAHWPSAARQDVSRERLRERASFHLLAPMIEAYFFGHAGSLDAAGAVTPPVLADGADLEDFTVVDAPYLDAPPAARTWARPDRARHPKSYLQYLIDPSMTTRYREVKNGVDALDVLDWGGLARRDRTHLALLRSMLADLADALGHEAPQGVLHPATARKAGLLRNV